MLLGQCSRTWIALLIVTLSGMVIAESLERMGAAEMEDALQVAD